MEKPIAIECCDRLNIVYSIRLSERPALPLLPPSANHDQARSAVARRPRRSSIARPSSLRPHRAGQPVARGGACRSVGCESNAGPRGARSTRTRRSRRTSAESRRDRPAAGRRRAAPHLPTARGLGRARRGVGLRTLHAGRSCPVANLVRRGGRAQRELCLGLSTSGSRVTSPDRRAVGQSRARSRDSSLPRSRATRARTSRRRFRGARPSLGGASCDSHGARTSASRRSPRRDDGPHSPRSRSGAAARFGKLSACGQTGEEEA